MSGVKIGPGSVLRSYNLSSGSFGSRGSSPGGGGEGGVSRSGGGGGGRGGIDVSEGKGDNPRTLLPRQITLTGGTGGQGGTGGTGNTWVKWSLTCPIVVAEKKHKEAIIRIFEGFIEKVFLLDADLP